MEGFWIQMRPCDLGYEVGSTQPRPYCLLCEEWADEGHLASRSHVQARRAVAGGPCDDGEEPESLEREPDVLHFGFLHSIDLSNPELQWPNKLRLLRIDGFIFVEGAQAHSVSELTTI